MKKASITEAKNNLSALIDSVKGGSPVLIVDRGRPVARLERCADGTLLRSVLTRRQSIATIGYAALVLTPFGGPIDVGGSAHVRRFASAAPGALLYVASRHPTAPMRSPAAAVVPASASRPPRCRFAAALTWTPTTIVRAE